MKEQDKLQRELNKARKELEKAKAETEKAKETEKVKKEAKKKLSDKGAAPPEPTRVSMTLEEKVAKYEELYETLKNENDVSGYNHLTSACIVVICHIRKTYESGLKENLNVDSSSIKIEVSSNGRTL